MIFKYFWITLITILLFLPASYAFYKYIFTVIIVVNLIFFFTTGRRYYLNSNITRGVLSAIGLGYLLCLYNFYLFQNLRPVTFWVLGPTVYLLLTLLFSSFDESVEILDTSLYAASGLISLVSLYYLASKLIGIPYVLDFLSLDQGFGLDERGFFAFTSNNLPALAFLIPYMMMNIFIVDRKKLFKKILLLLSLITAILSLRVAIMLNIFLSSIFVFLYYNWVYNKWKMSKILSYIILVLASVGLLYVIAFGYVMKTEFFRGIYDLKLAAKVSGEDPRYMQIKTWFKYFLESPLFGNGLSSTNMTVYDLKGKIIFEQRGPVRNDYGYEALYARALSEIGAIPLLFYFMLLVFLGAGLARVGIHGKSAEEKNAMSFLAGMVMMLIASSTNSYIQTFGYIWIVYFPVAYLNLVRKKQKSKHAGLVECS